MLFSSDAAASRDFLRDKLRLPFTDVGGGWLIFDLPETDLGVHPADPTDGAPPGTHDVSFFCDDIEGTIAELKSRGVRFKQTVADQGYGYVTYFEIPGGIEVQLYEPKYAKRSGAGSSSKKRTAKKKPAAKAKKKKKAAVKPAKAKKKATKARKKS